MDYSKIKVVEELENKFLVNEYLSLGWVMVNSYVTAYDSHPPGCYFQTHHYVLGWIGENPQYPNHEPPEDETFDAIFG